MIRIISAHSPESMPAKWANFQLALYFQICKTLTPLSELVIDGFIQGILESVPEDMKSVEFTPEGFWRIKEGSESFLPIKKSSVDCYSDSNQQNTVIDLTFDTPPKIVPKKISNGDENCGGSNPQIQVIDLTVSP